MKKLVILVAILIPALSKSGDKATITRIVDGDTLEAIYQGKKEKIRLIGVDSPESKNNRKARKDAKKSGQEISTIIFNGKKAAAFTKSLIKKGDRLLIEFDKQKHDRYGRLLAYVYLITGQMLNEEILKAGYAQIMTIRPNIRYQKRFRKAYISYRSKK